MAHVPRFGNWEDGDQGPYTVCFENARASKGGKKFKPNDPQENPDAFSGGKAKANNVANEPRPPHAQYEPTAMRRSLPQFGDWENSSAEGYTVIFNNVREGKEFKNAEIPVSDTKNHHNGVGNKLRKHGNPPSCFGGLFKSKR